MSAASEEVIELYRKVFSSFDRDGNGKISADELDLGLRDLGMERNQGSIRRMIADADTNDDQELDFDEFVHLIESEQLEKLFEGEGKRDLQRQQSVTRFQDIYGQTPTPPETEKSIKSGLEQLQMELDAMGNEQKEGFNRALEKCPHLIDDKFLLMFLRSEVFHAGRAAQRLVKYWDTRIELFGETKAFMRLTQDEALADDSAALALGIIRPTGQSDPAGRGIVLQDYTNNLADKAESMSRCRAMWYGLHVALEDEKTQKEGFITLVKAHGSMTQCDVKTSKVLTGHIKGVIPCRLGCLHVLHPPSYVTITLKIARLFMGKKLRNRIRLHAGTQDEVLESTAEYGVPKSAIPDIWGGELEYDGWAEWLEARRAIENGRE